MTEQDKAKWEEKLVHAIAKSMALNVNSSVDEILADYDIPEELKNEEFYTVVLLRSLLVFQKILLIIKEKGGIPDVPKVQ